MVTERAATGLSVLHDGNVDVASASDAVDVKVCMTVQHLPGFIRSTTVCRLDRVSRSQYHQSVLNIETCSEVFHYQHTRELISTRETSDKLNKDLSRLQ